MIPTIEEIKDQIKTDIESETSKTAPALSVTVWKIIATAFSAPFRLVYKYVDWVYRQIFTRTADREALILQGDEFGLRPTAATRWIGEVIFTGSNGSTIASGATLTANSIIYRTTEGGTISGGSVTLEVESVERGSSTQLESGNTLSSTSPIAGVDSIATVDSVTQNASDAESTEAFRTRLLTRKRLKPQGGSIPDYILWALEVAGISYAYVDRPQGGFINIYPLTNDPDPANRIPDAAKLTEVEDYVSDTSRRPLNANVAAVAFTELEFDVTISNLFPDTSALRSAITSQIEEYLYAARPRQFADDTDTTEVISASDIATLATLAGAEALTVDLRIQPADTSLSSYTLQAGELAIPGTIDYA